MKDRFGSIFTAALVAVAVICLLNCSIVTSAEPGAAAVWDVAAGPPAAENPGAPSAAAVAAFSNQFNSALMKAIDNGVKEGKIGRFQALKAKILVRLSPSTAKEIQDAVVDEAVAQKKLAGAAEIYKPGFDISSLIALITQLLPLIMQIISMFGGL